jgi:hypothetical protein
MSAADLAGLNAACLRQFGEPVVFWPAAGNETEATAIVFQSSRPEEASPGNVTRLFVLASALPDTLARNATVRVRGEDFTVTDVEQAADGSLTVLLRRK